MRSISFAAGRFLMITCVLAQFLGARQRSSSWAEPRTRRAVLISARFRMSRGSLLPDSMRASRSMRSCSPAQLGEERHAERVDPGHGARERHRLAAGAHVGDVARRVIPVDDARLLERALEVRALGEQAQERLADQAAGAGGEKVLGGGVGVAHGELVVQHHHCRGQQVQAGERGGH
jgi:hypothetical protein